MKKGSNFSTETSLADVALNCDSVTSNCCDTELSAPNETFSC